ncbi:MAG: HD domain-containing protein [Alphaproteobacteria bacterium]|nr:MAG: HD domain-containing protein [Alphaproteobacteria bacterium]
MIVGADQWAAIRSEPLYRPSLIEEAKRQDGLIAEPSIMGWFVDLWLELKEFSEFRAVNRIAVALFDTASGRLYTDCEVGDSPVSLSGYQVDLAQCASLLDLAYAGGERVLNRTRAPTDLSAQHTKRLWRAGFRASYTFTIGRLPVLGGFIFVNSFEPDAFQPSLIRRLSPYVRLIAERVRREANRARVMSAAIRAAQCIGARRDNETGAHLVRMGLISGVLAARAAEVYGLSREDVRHIREYAPLHDLGKVAIPDEILFKTGRLTPAEFEVMKTHVSHGANTVCQLVDMLGADDYPELRFLFEVVAFHHETLDGLGYPFGISGDRIPPSTRIVTVADIFDALTSERAYKERWPVDRAVSELALMRDQGKLCPVAVGALIEALPEVVTIHEAHMDETG